MKGKLRKCYDTVEKILMECPSARDSDDVLYIEVVKRTNKIVLDRPFAEVMLHFKDYDLPHYKSIERARRKVQADNHFLRASKAVDDARFESYKDIKDWAHE